MAGAHPRPVTARKPENLIHSRRKQGLSKCPGAGVSGARGAGDAGDASAELGVPMDAAAGEAQARMGLAFSQPKTIWASLDGLGASPRLGEALWHGTATRAGLGEAGSVQPWHCQAGTGQLGRGNAALLVIH